MKRSLTIITILTALAVAAGTSLAAEIKIGGGGTPIDNIINPVKDAFEKSTGIKVKIVFSNATIAFKQLFNGELDASAAGIELPDLIEAAKKEGVVVKNPADFSAALIGKGKIYTAINKANPASKVSMDQLKGIFTGKIANWKEVGGSDQPIIVVLSNINPATNAAFKKLVMNNEPYSKEVLEVGKYDDMRTTISVTPEAIGFGPPSLIDASVKGLETPEVARSVILTTKGKPSPEVQKLIDFIGGEGQKYIKK